MRSLKPAVLVEADETFEFSATLNRRYRTGDSGMIEIRQRISTPFSGVSGIPATVAEPEAGATEQAERPHRCGLPGTVRPEETQHLPVADLKGDVAEGDRSQKRLPELWTQSARASHSTVGMDLRAQSLMIDQVPRDPWWIVTWLPPCEPRA